MRMRLQTTQKRRLTASLRFAALSLAALALCGCGGLLLNQFYALETARESFLIEDFPSDNPHNWSAGAENTSGPWYDYIPDYYVSYGLRQVLAYGRELPTDTEIRIEWSRWLTDIGPGTRDNFDSFDFRIVLHSDPIEFETINEYVPSGPVIAFKLDQMAAITSDRLWIAEGPDGAADRTESPTIASPGVDERRGVFSVIISTDTTPETIFASVEDETGAAILEVERQLTTALPDRFHLTVQSSGGGTFEPRVIDSVVVLEAP